MTDTITHLDVEALSAYADGELDPPAVARAERHLSECARCRETLARVRELVAAAHALPRDIDPPAEVWTELRARVARAPRRRMGERLWSRAGWLATAAAVVLVAGTAILMPGANGKAKGKGPPSVAASVATPVVLSVDRNYSPTVDQLREILESQRGTLSPATVAIVERSLALIDQAIEEARAALASDPANRALVDLLASHYERKVDLLQRATKLSPSL